MKKFISCDWGTSSLRIRIYDPETRVIIAGAESDRGVFTVHQSLPPNSSESQKLSFYRSAIQTLIDQLRSRLNEDVANMRVIISGMASSTIGMKLLPYARLPFSTTGAGLETFLFEKENNFNEALLISGVRDEADVMRGEETELVGFHNMLANDGSGTYIFPGTHSKHVLVENNEVRSFQTFMTGELFALISSQSILRSAIQEGELKLESFERGVTDSTNENLLNKLFSIRVNELFSLANKEENYFYLSGLLIGHELQALKKTASRSILICARGSIAFLYERALHLLGHADKTRNFSDHNPSIAAPVGQYLIYQKSL